MEDPARAADSMEEAHTADSTEDATGDATDEPAELTVVSVTHLSPSLARVDACGGESSLVMDVPKALLHVAQSDLLRLRLDHSLPYACNAEVVARGRDGEVAASVGGMLLIMRGPLGLLLPSGADTFKLSVSVRQDGRSSSKRARADA